MNFSKEEEVNIWGILASILHLAKLQFDPTTLTNGLPLTFFK